MQEELDYWIKEVNEFNPKTKKEEKKKFRGNPSWENAFQDSWITDEADKALITFAKNAGEYMAPVYDRDNDALSNSQIRNVFGEIKRIQMKGLNDKDNRSSFYLLRAKVAYAAGRNKTKSMALFEKIFNKAWLLVDGDTKKFQNFCNFLEAILAYHKSFGGK